MNEKLDRAVENNGELISLEALLARFFVSFEQVGTFFKFLANTSIGDLSKHLVCLLIEIVNFSQSFNEKQF